MQRGRWRIYEVSRNFIAPFMESYIAWLECVGTVKASRRLVLGDGDDGHLLENNIATYRMDAIHDK